MAGTFKDQSAIQKVIARYCYAIDFDDEVSWLKCFTKEAVFESPLGRFVGHEGLKSFLEGFKKMRSTYPNLRHYVMNTITDIEDVNATSRSYLLLAFTGKDGPKIMTTGRYEDKLVKLRTRWYLEHRMLMLDAPPAG